MVEYKSQEVWRCPYCEKVYEKWEDAVECATECADIDYPEADTKEIYICEFCNKEYEDDTDAEDCEKKHKELRDEFLGRKRMKEAGNHPNQNKLIEVNNVR